MTTTTHPSTVAKIIETFKKADNLARRDEARAAAFTVNAYQRLQRTHGPEKARIKYPVHPATATTLGRTRDE